MFRRESRDNGKVLLVLAVALGARILVSAWQVHFGFQGIPTLFTVNTWADFYAIYQSWLQSVAHGMIPYRDFFSYTYPPLFLYALYPFYAIAGTSGASLPIIVSDAATSALVFLIANKLASPKLAMAAGLAYALCPFAVFYEGYLWLSSQPMTFFVLLALLLLRTNRPTQSAFALALAVLFKQEALFVLPVYGLWFARWSGGSKWKGVMTFLLTIVAASIPFLLISPGNYFLSLSHLVASGPARETCVNRVLNATTVAVCGGSGGGLNSLAFPPPALKTTVVPANAFPWEYSLDRLAAIVGPLLLALEVPALIASRRARNALELFAAYSTVCLLMLFAYLTGILLSYHFLPVFALLFASATSRRTLLVATIAPFVALFLLPEGRITAILALVAILAILALQDEPRALVDEKTAFSVQ